MNAETSTMHIVANIPVWILLFSILAALVFSIWAYKRTWPPTGLTIRWTLIMLRWGALIGGILIISHPELELKENLLEPASIGVLIDQSASMSITQGEVDRQQIVRDILNSQSFSDLNKRQRLNLFTFSDSLSERYNNVEIPEDVSANGIGTNISRAWMEAYDKLALSPPAALIMISDGVHNSGPDPIRLARTARTAIYTIGVGSSEKYRDIMLLNVSANPVVYQGSTNPVEIGFRCIGAAGKSLTIAIKNSNGKLIVRKQLTVTSDYYEGTEFFDIVINQPGKRRFQVEISTIENELTTDNNHRSFYMNVLASKMRVLLMSGPPDNGLGDIVRKLSNDDHIELIQRTSRSGSFYEGDWPDTDMLGKVDVVILHHFPIKSTNSNKLKEFAEAVKESELPLGFFDGGTIDYNKLKLFESILPVTVRKYPKPRVEGQVIPNQRHAIIADPEEINFSAEWLGLPPLKYNPDRFDFGKHVNVLAEFHTLELLDRFPAIVVSETGGVKSVAILGNDLWRWGLVSTVDEGVIGPLLSRLVRWLAVRKAGKRVELTFDKELFSNQESVAFSVSVFNENYFPLEDALVSAVISKSDTVGGETLLTGIGAGRYRGIFQPYGEGEYQIKASASLDGLNLGEDIGRITVEPFNIELLDAKLNEQLLKSVAEFSGGAYFQSSQVDSLFDSLDLPLTEREEITRWQLWGRGWILAIIVGLLTIEWFIRIRTGML
ncbi:MAG: VWA domain-containing protein [Calditrichaeota bacterium]|nr:VWA domain-containing protein [Calditrichota bacterium]